MNTDDRMFEIVKRLLNECRQFENGSIQLGSLLSVEEKNVLSEYMVQHMFPRVGR